MFDRTRHGATRTSLEATNAVAAAYWRAGRFDDARELLERVLTDCRAVLGPRDPDTLVVEGNLAVTHICLEHVEQGLDLLRGGAPTTPTRSPCGRISHCCPGTRRRPPGPSSRRSSICDARRPGPAPAGYDASSS